MIKRSKTGLAVKYVLLSLFAVITLFPIFVTVWGGLKSLAQLRLDLFGVPNPVMWENFTGIFDLKKSKFFIYLFNSTFIMVLTVALDLLLSGLAAYALSKIKFFGREIIYNFFLIGLLFPFAVIILPLYLVIDNLKLINTYFGVILPQVAFGMPFHIMLMRSFFMMIPKELEEAATIDGCGHFRILINIILPLSTPILTTIAVLTMVGSWNGYLLPLLVLNDSKMFTLPLGVMDFQTQYLFEWNRVLAFISLAMVPVIAFYIFAQKYIIAGLTGGALKG